MADRGLLCIDWDERSLRVVDARFSHGGVVIRQALHVPLAAGTDVRDPASLGDFIRRTLGEHRIRTRRAIADVPRQDAVLNLLTLPDASADELAAMVGVQIVKELPFSKDQAVIDFAVAREKAAPACDVWVSAVRRHVIDHFQQVIRTAGLKLERIGLRPYANLAAVTADGSAPGRTLTLDVGPSLTEINVIHEGRLVYSRAASVSVPRGGLSVAAAPAAPAEPSYPQEPADATIPLSDDFVPKPGPMDALLIEVSRTIEAYRAADPGATIDRIVLSGSAGVDDELRQVFESRFDSPTSLYEAPRSLRWRRARGVSAVPFSAAVGLALSHMTEGVLRFDFLHPKEPEAGRREWARRVPMIAATVGLFVAAAGVAAYQPLRALKAESSRLDARIKARDRDKKQRKAFLDQYGDVEAWQSESVIWIDQLKRLADVFPSNQEAYITNLECDEKGRITLELAAKDRKVATKLITSIENITARSKSLFRLDLKLADGLDEGTLSPEVREAFAGHDVPLSPRATVSIEAKGSKWQIADGGRWYVVTKGDDGLKAYKAEALFEAEPSDAKLSKDPTYPVSDEVIVQVKSMKSEK